MRKKCREWGVEPNRSSSHMKARNFSVTQKYKDKARNDDWRGNQEDKTKQKPRRMQCLWQLLWLHRTETEREKEREKKDTCFQILILTDISARHLGIVLQDLRRLLGPQAQRQDTSGWCQTLLSDLPSSGWPGTLANGALCLTGTFPLTQSLFCKGDFSSLVRSGSHVTNGGKDRLLTRVLLTTQMKCHSSRNNFSFFFPLRQPTERKVD